MICVVCGREETPDHFVEDWKEFLLKHQLCSHCAHWKRQLEADQNERAPHTFAVIDGTHYVIGPEDEKSHFRGFGGTEFQIEFFDGTKVVTTNLWCQGDISKEWRDKFPDNARFERNLKWKRIGNCQYLV